MLPKKKPVTKQLELDLEPPEQYELFGSDVDFTINLNDVMSDPNWYSTGMNTMLLLAPIQLVILLQPLPWGTVLPLLRISLPRIFSTSKNN